MPTAAGPGLAQRLSAGRAQWRQELREEFDQEMKGAAPGLRAAQIAQSYVVPAQIAIGVESHHGRVLSAEDVFDDAIRSVLASVHVEFKQWDAAAQNVEVITRALKRIIQQGDPTLEHGRTPGGVRPRRRPDPRGRPSAGLRR
ncbi:hypothetical protein LT493_12840 [Streptomyces tricolor]|nr:hypothetical protein [Streptomyces tricolor]